MINVCQNQSHGIFLLTWKLSFLRLETCFVLKGCQSQFFKSVLDESYLSTNVICLTKTCETENQNFILGNVSNGFDKPSQKI
jgi:hypothetical protein